jgi:hypothetical protein
VFPSAFAYSPITWAERRDRKNSYLLKPWLLALLYALFSAALRALYGVDTGYALTWSGLKLHPFFARRRRLPNVPTPPAHLLASAEDPFICNEKTKGQENLSLGSGNFAHFPVRASC